MFMKVNLTRGEGPITYKSIERGEDEGGYTCDSLMLDNLS